MAKPTLLQTLLNKPSQSYIHPHQKEYHSSRQHMLHVASQVNANAPPVLPTSEDDRCEDKGGYVAGFGQPLYYGYLESSQERIGEGIMQDSNSHYYDDSHSHEKHQDCDELAEERPYSTKMGQHDDQRVLKPRGKKQITRETQMVYDHTNILLLSGDEDKQSSSSESEDVFYTPNTSPQISLAPSLSFTEPLSTGHQPERKLSRRTLKLQSSLEQTTLDLEMASRQLASTTSTDKYISQPQQQGHSTYKQGSMPAVAAITSAQYPIDATTSSNYPTHSTPQQAVPSTRTPTRSASLTQNRKQVTLSASSMSSNSLDGHSVFSDLVSDSTPLTTPLQSDSDSIMESYQHHHQHQEDRHNKNQTSPKRKNYAYTDEDWAKDVRWLVPPSNGHNKQQHTQRHRSAAKATITPKRRQGKAGSYAAAGYYFTTTTTTTVNAGNVKTMAPSRRISSARTAQNMMMNMTALVEEDEELVGEERRLPSMRPAPKGSGSSLRSSRSRSRSRQGLDTLRHRRSRSLETALPVPSGDLPSQGTPGYTSLLLPRAPVSVLSTTDTSTIADGRVDLTRSGIAQTTMASVEVVRGLGSRRGFIGMLKGLGVWRRDTVQAIPRERIASRNASGVLGFTSYRKPPEYVPSGSVLVQVWAVGVDGVDGRLVGIKIGMGGGTAETDKESEYPVGNSSPGQGLQRSVSLKERLTRAGSIGKATGRENQPSPQAQAGVGYIPGRSFVGRVLECGWEVREEVVRKGEWVVGLLDVRKCGAFTEFLVVDRHRIQRVPHPQKQSLNDPNLISFSLPSLPSLPARSLTDSRTTPSSTRKTPPNFSLEELALLPLCGVPAYRAVSTFVFAFSSRRDLPSTRPHLPAFDIDSGSDKDSTHTGSPRGNEQEQECHGTRPSILVLYGHDGIGGLAVQMLVRHGFRVCVHAPCAPTIEMDADAGERYMTAIERRVQAWGAEEVIFDDGEIGPEGGRGPVVRMMEGLRHDGDVFDGVLDTVGGRDVREVAERLLRSPGTGNSKDSVRGTGKKGGGQFTTLVGDVPERTIPSAGDHFRAGLRSLRSGGGTDGSTRSDESGGGRVGYAWVSVAQDVDWDGEDVRGSIGAVLGLAMEGHLRPWVGPTSNQGNVWEGKRVVPFEKAPEVFVEGGPLEKGGTVVVKVVG